MNITIRPTRESVNNSTASGDIKQNGSNKKTASGSAVPSRQSLSSQNKGPVAMPTPFRFANKNKTTMPTMTGSGISSASGPIKNNFSSNDVAVRDAMVAMGFDNGKIGWDGQNVTYDGKHFLTPNRNDDGTTKTDTTNFISAANKYYGSTGENNSMVDVTGYVTGNTGMSGLVEYGSNGSVSVGGVQIPNTVIIDGQAYATQSAIKEAVSQYKKNSQTDSSPIDIYNQFEQKTADDYSRIINSLRNYQYDPEKDKVYQAYKEMYHNAGQEARDNTYGALAARTGGYGNSAAIAAAAGAYNDYMKELNSQIPILAQQDYQRKLDELGLYGSPLQRMQSKVDVNAVHADAIRQALGDRVYNEYLNKQLDSQNKSNNAQMDYNYAALAQDNVHFLQGDATDRWKTEYGIDKNLEWEKYQYDNGGKDLTSAETELTKAQTDYYKRR